MGAGILIAQISSHVARAHGLLTAQGSAVEDMDANKCLGLSSFIGSGLFHYYLLSSASTLERLVGKQFPLPRSDRCLQYQVTAFLRGWAYMYVDRCRSKPISPSRSLLRNAVQYVLRYTCTLKCSDDESKHSVSLFGLHDRCLPDLCAEDGVPEFAGDSKAVLVVEEVMLEVVFLKLLVPERQILVMQEVVCHVVTRVTEHAAREYSHGNIPVPEEDGVCEFPEWRHQHQEERGWHDEPILVHRQIVVDTVQGEVQGNTDSVVREVANTSKVSHAMIKSWHDKA